MSFKFMLMVTRIFLFQSVSLNDAGKYSDVGNRGVETTS
jgi:hypothetical protein